MTTKAAGNQIPRKELVPEPEELECKNYSVEVGGEKFGFSVPRSRAHGLTNIAELVSDHFFTFSWDLHLVFETKNSNFIFFNSVVTDLWSTRTKLLFNF